MLLYNKTAIFFKFLSILSVFLKYLVPLIQKIITKICTTKIYYYSIIV